MNPKIKSVFGAASLGTLVLMVLFGPAANPSPAAILTVTSGLQLWLEADKGVTTNASGVTTWADQSGSNDATQTISTQEPQLVANAAPNGYKPAIYFAGGSSSLDLPNITQATASTLFFVYYSDPSGGISQQLLERSGGGPSPYARNGATEQPYFYPWQFYPSSISGTNIVEFAYNDVPTVGTSSIAVNGGAANTVVFDGSPYTSFGLGNWTKIVQNAFAQDFKGDIEAVLIYDRALDPTETASVASYLNEQWFVAPEPASMSLLLVGGFWLTTRRRRVA